MTEQALLPLGLTASEARSRLRTFGPNALPEEKRPSFLLRLGRQFQNALLYLLLVALAFDVAAWIYNGAHGAPVEALAILAVLMLNAGLGVAQEYRSERALDELKKLGSPRVWALRDGELSRIDARELVPGDVVRLEPGDRVPADGAAAGAEALSVDESLLTGESLPVDKPDGSELFSGSVVMRGRGDLAVSRTGKESTMGRLAGSLAGIEVGKTPLELRIDELGSKIARYVGALSFLLVVGGVLSQGVSHFPNVVMFAVAFGVAVVPESMPAMMTLALAFGVQRMARRRAVVRRLSAVEALGAVTVIASDKTGTLTSNQIVVEALHAVDEDEALLALALANDAEYGHEAGDPLERALVEYARGRGADVHALRTAYPRVASRPFDSRWKYMRVSVMGQGSEPRSYVKGAVEVVLERSRIDAEARRSWLERAAEQAGAGYKVLGLARGRHDAETELSFLGFVTLWDPPRPEARQAVQAAKDAGITVLMVTGDHPETARAIGERVGIESARVLTGADIEALSPEEIAASIDGVRIFSRMLPEHKLRIVEALQARGDVVAMTGDGLNDAPALKRADVGVAMGERGSEVAREVADVVLLDDNFSTIVAAIEEGRVIYENIMNFIRYTFSSNVALMLLVLGGAAGSLMLGLRTADGGVLLPLTALQVLWINFLGDGPPALALSVDRNPRVMRAPPRARNSTLLDARAVKFILVNGGFKGAVGLLLLVLLPHFGVGLPATATVVFLYESTAKVLSAYPARKIGPSPQMNLALHASIAAGVLLGFLCVLVEPLRRTLGLASIGLHEVWPLGVATLVTVASGELLARSIGRQAKQ